MKTSHVRTTGTLAVVLGLALGGGGLTAQEPMEGTGTGWDVTLVGEAGGVLPTRDLGKTTMIQPTGLPAQMRSQVITGPILGLGVELQSPWEALRVRLMGRTTLAGGAEGQLVGCEVLTAEEAQGACVTVESPGSVRSFTAGLVFIRRRTEGERFRPYLTLDGGLRQFSFDEGSCGDDATGDPSWISAVCSGQSEITEDQTRAVLMAGVGLRVSFDRASGYLHVADAFGAYEIGAGEAEGEAQNAIVFTVVVAYPLGR